MSRNCSSKMAMSQFTNDYHQIITSRKFMAVTTWWDQVIIVVVTKKKNNFSFISYYIFKLYRFFILWYQILGHNAPDSVHAIFATLVPGFSSPIPQYPGLVSSWNHDHHDSATSYDNCSSRTLFNYWFNPKVNIIEHNHN